jgi:alpha-glucosidase
LAREWTWWRDGVLYQAYPRSFADSNADGVGDLRGLEERLDHLQWLGVDGIWLNPIFPSPDDDMGYDVADYRGVQPVLGDMTSARSLIGEAGRRGMKVLLDLVAPHSSDRHPWFLDARSSRSASHRDWYVWADPKPDGSPPNNWLSVFGGPAWMLDDRTGQYYLHTFLATQPDLNWWNPKVRDEFDAILRFWFDRGAAGFRVDSVRGLLKDRLLRDNPPAEESDHPLVRRGRLRPVYTADLPEIHEVLRRWRALCDSYREPRVLVGETWLFDLARLATYYGQGDQLHLNFNFLFVHSPFEAAALCAAVESLEEALPEVAWPVWTASNHDVSRFPTRWAEGSEAKSRLGLLILLTLRGTPFLYYGDEIGMTDVDVPAERATDPLAHRFPGQRRGRDPERTPMQWAQAAGGGFTAPGIEPWLPLGDLSRNVEAQRSDPASILNLCRDLIALRRRRTELHAGAYQTLPAPAGAWAWRRGASTVVAVNLSDDPVRLPGLKGRLLIATDRRRDGENVRGPLELQPWQGAVLSEMR